jgi:hypothetical protein
MKKLLVVLSFLLVPGIAGAQEICLDGDPCRTATGKQAQAQSYFRDQHNEQMCDSVELPSDCTQAQFDAAGGSGTIYATNAAGLRLFFMDKIFDHLARQQARDESEFKGRMDNVWQQASDAQKAAMCAAGGADADCVLP